MNICSRTNIDQIFNCFSFFFWWRFNQVGPVYDTPANQSPPFPLLPPLWSIYEILTSPEPFDVCRPVIPPRWAPHLTFRVPRSYIVHAERQEVVFYGLTAFRLWFLFFFWLITRVIDLLRLTRKRCQLEQNEH